MGRLLIWLLLAGLVWWLWRSRQRLPSAPSRTPKPDAPPHALTMLRCVHCGMHLPAADTVADTAGRPYCSTAHRDLGPTT